MAMSFCVNVVIYFLRYFVNQFAFIQIFWDPGGYWVAEQ